MIGQPPPAACRKLRTSGPPWEPCRGASLCVATECHWHSVHNRDSDGDFAPAKCWLLPNQPFFRKSIIFIDLRNTLSGNAAAFDPVHPQMPSRLRLATGNLNSRARLQASRNGRVPQSERSLPLAVISEPSHPSHWHSSLQKMAAPSFEADDAEGATVTTAT